jgi:hypothetical protein
VQIWHQYYADDIKQLQKKGVPAGQGYGLEVVARVKMSHLVIRFAPFSDALWTLSRIACISGCCG